MHPTISLLLHIFTAITVGLSAGLLFAYSVSVNPGLGSTDDAAYLSAMQGINKAIQNPVFFIVYFSPVFLLPLCSWQAYKVAPTAGFALLTTAAVLYLVGVVGVTIGGNVPLNNALEAVQINGSTAEELRHHRSLFEGPWNRRHTVRTLSAIISLALLLLAFIKYPSVKSLPG